MGEHGEGCRHCLDVLYYVKYDIKQRQSQLKTPWILLKHIAEIRGVSERNE